MASEINENIKNSYLKVLNIDKANYENFKAKFSNKHEDLFNMVIEQNHNVLVECSKIYESFNENKENTQNELLKLDEVLGRVAVLKAPRSTGRGIGGSSDYNNNELGSSTFSEFEKKIGELEKQIELNKQKIEAEKKDTLTTNDKIKDTNDYLSKFVLEKKLYLDKVIDDSLRDMTYGSGFKHLYQAKVMKMIFESILLDKVQDQINHEAEKISVEKSSEKYEQHYNGVLSKVTFEWFKVKFL